jgi:hypothetical protein
MIDSPNVYWYCILVDWLLLCGAAKEGAIDLVVFLDIDSGVQDTMTLGNEKRLRTATSDLYIGLGYVKLLK